MDFLEVLRAALDKRATDIHLVPDQPAIFRANRELIRSSFFVSADELSELAEELLTPVELQRLWTQGSADLSLNLGNIQCRINAFQTDLGVSFSIRILLNASVRLSDCNLHPVIGQLIERGPGLVIVSGPTGSGKSTTLAALVEEINLSAAKNIISIESPIEYRITSKRSLIRQRQVGLHTPNFEQGLMDALREDPDVLVVGEMRDPETMRKTLVAAESGHLVLATMHSSNSMDALYRLMMSFQGEQQNSILAQIADCLIGVVSQRLHFLRDVKMLVPCCEILFANHAVRNLIRKGEISKLAGVLQTGAAEGMMTFDRYENWIGERNDWLVKSRPRETLPSLDLRALKASRRSLAGAGVGADAAPSSAVSKPVAAGSKLSSAEGIAAEEQSLDVPEDVVLKKQKELAQKLGLGDLPNHRLSRPVKRAPVLRHQQMSPEEAPVESRKSGTKQTRILDDGRIEIPEVEIDLEALVREIKKGD